MAESDFKGQASLNKTEFDCYLMVDWSAANKPKWGEDAVWYCFCDRAADAPKIENPETRRKASDKIAEILHQAVEQQKAVLVGFDFAFGYPAGFSTALGLISKHPWRAIWDELGKTVIDDDKNRSNRFEVAGSFNCKISGQPFPFWGRPETLTSHWIPQKRGRLHLAEFRVTDQRAKGAQPVWKLFGNGAVGSMSLVGIPCVARLRDDEKLSQHSTIRPFETGLSRLPARNQRKWLILYAEIFPSMFKATVGRGEIKDEAQVRGLVRLLKDEDEKGRLGEWFAGPKDLDKKDKRKIVSEEGGILGVR